jgi:hypothetical protein
VNRTGESETESFFGDWGFAVFRGGDGRGELEMEGEGNGVFGLLQRQDQHHLISSRASGRQNVRFP